MKTPLLALILLIVLSCNKDEIDIDCRKTNNSCEDILFSPKQKLKTIRPDSSNNYLEFFSYKYDDLNRLIEEKIVFKEIFNTLRESPVPADSTINYKTYTYCGNKISNLSEKYFSFVDDKKSGRLIRDINYYIENEELLEAYNCNIDSGGNCDNFSYDTYTIENGLTTKLVRYNDCSKTSTHFSQVYSYDSNNNIIQIIDSYNSNSYTIEYTYDNKNSPFADYDFRWSNILRPLSRYGTPYPRHNILSYTKKDQNNNVIESYNVEYIYNEFDYPIEAKFIFPNRKYTYLLEYE